MIQTVHYKTGMRMIWHMDETMREEIWINCI